MTQAKQKVNKAAIQQRLDLFIAFARQGVTPPTDLMVFVADHLESTPIAGNEKNSGRRVGAGRGVPLEMLSIQCLVMQEHVKLTKGSIADKICRRETLVEKRRIKEKHPGNYEGIDCEIGPMPDKTIQRLIVRAKQLREGIVPDVHKSETNIALSRDAYCAFEICAVQTLLHDSDWSFGDGNRKLLQMALDKLQAVRDKRHRDEYGPEDKIWAGPLDAPHTLIESSTPSE